MTRICPVCKGPIHRRSDRAIYCSAQCKDARNNAAKAAQRHGRLASTQTRSPS